MNKKQAPLAAKYGKLVVNKEENIWGRRIVTVTCTSCGRTKQVHASSLISGDARSCGRIGCKDGSKVIKVRKDYKPTGSRLMNLPTTKRLWKDFESGKFSGIQLAEKYRQKPNWVYSMITTIKSAGGIDRYVALVAKPRQ